MKYAEGAGSTCKGNIGSSESHYRLGRSGGKNGLKGQKPRIRPGKRGKGQFEGQLAEHDNSREEHELKKKWRKRSKDGLRARGRKGGRRSFKKARARKMEGMQSRLISVGT